MKMDKELSFVCMGWSTTDKDEQGAIIRAELNNGTERGVGIWLKMGCFSAIRSLVPVAWGNYGILSQSIHLRWPYHWLYMITLYRNDYLKLESTQRQEQKDAINVVNKDSCFSMQCSFDVDRFAAAELC